MTLNWLDFLFIIILAGALILGIIKGFVKDIFSLAGIIASIYFATTFYSKFSHITSKFMGSPNYAKAASFIIIIIAVYITFKLIGFLFAKILHKIKLGPADRFCGAILGIIKSIIVCWILIVILSFFSVNAVSRSFFVPYFEKVFSITLNFFPFDLKEIIKKKELIDAKT